LKMLIKIRKRKMKEKMQSLKNRSFYTRLKTLMNLYESQITCLMTLKARAKRNHLLHILPALFFMNLLPFSVKVTQFNQSRSKTQHLQMVKLKTKIQKEMRRRNLVKEPRILLIH